MVDGLLAVVSDVLAMSTAGRVEVFSGRLLSPEFEVSLTSGTFLDPTGPQVRSASGACVGHSHTRGWISLNDASRFKEPFHTKQVRASNLNEQDDTNIGISCLGIGRLIPEP